MFLLKGRARGSGKLIVALGVGREQLEGLTGRGMVITLERWHVSADHFVILCTESEADLRDKLAKVMAVESVISVTPGVVEEPGRA